MANISRWEKFSDVELMIGLWYGEARLVEDSFMEEIREYLAIGSVVMNRVKMARWGKTIKSVILAPKQFSCFNQGDVNEPLIYSFLTTKTSSAFYQRLILYAESVIEGRCRDFSEGATHYVARTLYEKIGTRNHPWIPKMRITAVWGGHVFLSEQLFR